MQTSLWILIIFLGFGLLGFILDLLNKKANQRKSEKTKLMEDAIRSNHGSIMQKNHNAFHRR